MSNKKDNFGYNKCIKGILHERNGQEDFRKVLQNNDKQ